MLEGLTVTGIAIVIGIIFISMAAHEAVHAFTAHWLGDTTAKDEGRLTLNPIKHVDLYTTILLPVVLLLLHLPPIFIAKPVPFNPDRVRYGELGAAMVALAGPFTNLVIAFVVSLFIRASGVYGAGLEVLELAVYINIIFFVFNMIPFPPLDGSRLLYAFAPDPVRRVMAQIEAAGLIALVIFLLLLLPFLGPVITDATQTIYNFLLS